MKYLISIFKCRYITLVTKEMKYFFSTFKNQQIKVNYTTSNQRNQCLAK